MKNKLDKDSLVPFLEDRLQIKFDSLKDIKGEVIRKGLTSLVIDPEDEMCVIVKISSIGVDRSGEVVIPEGVITSDFIKNPIVCWSHDYSLPPLGRAESVQITKDAVFAKIRFGSTERCKEIWTLVKDKVLNAMSIGFVPLEILVKGTKQFNDYVKEKLVGVINNIDEINKIITRSVLLEVSWVNLPCNQDALVQYMSTKQLSDDFKKFLGFKEIVKDESGTIQGSDLPKEIATDNTTNGETVKSPEVAITPVQEPEPIKETGIGRITEPPKTEIQIIDNQPIIENNPSEIIPQGQVEVEQVAVCSDTSVLTEVPRYFNIVYEPVKSIVDVEIKKIKGRVS